MGGVLRNRRPCPTSPSGSCAGHDQTCSAKLCWPRVPRIGLEHVVVFKLVCGSPPCALLRWLQLVWIRRRVLQRVRALLACVSAVRPRVSCAHVLSYRYDSASLVVPPCGCISAAVAAGVRACASRYRDVSVRVRANVHLCARAGSAWVDPDPDSD